MKPNPISAYIGIAGAIGMAISDVILLSVPSAGWESDIASFSSLAHISMWRMKYGPLIGWFSSFFICFGFWYVGRQLSHLGEKLSMMLFLGLSSMMVYGGAYHAAYYFAGVALTAGNTAMYQAFIEQLQYMSYIGVPGLLIGTGIYIYLLSRVPNGFPVWLRYTNILLLQGVYLGTFMLLPSPLGGLIKPTFINLASITFFVIHLLVKEKPLSSEI